MQGGLSGLGAAGARPDQWGRRCAAGAGLMVLRPARGRAARARRPSPGSAHITADELIPQRLLEPGRIQDILAAAQSSCAVAPAGAAALVHH